MKVGKLILHPPPLFFRNASKYRTGRLNITEGISSRGNFKSKIKYNLILVQAFD